jgi:hypothetical protein
MSDTTENYITILFLYFIYFNLKLTFPHKEEDLHLSKINILLSLLGNIPLSLFIRPCLHSG